MGFHLSDMEGVGSTRVAARWGLMGGGAHLAWLLLPPPAPDEAEARPTTSTPTAGVSGHLPRRVAYQNDQGTMPHRMVGRYAAEERRVERGSAGTGGPVGERRRRGHREVG